MKTLILIRHAKSSWKHPVIDHQRPLNKRGTSDVTLMANHFKTLDLTPNLVLVSDALRTQLTAKTFVETLNIPSEKIQLSQELYDFEGTLLTKTIKACPDTVETLMVFGHNHAVTTFVNTHGSTAITNVPTCGIVVIHFDITQWKDLKLGKTAITLFPKEIAPKTT